MSHHAEHDLGRELRELIGPTRAFPRGKISSDDEGEIKVAIARDPESQTVIIDFGSPVTWIGFSGEQAVEIADLLIAHANALRGIT